jgi:hypothetical protein
LQSYFDRLAVVLGEGPKSVPAADELAKWALREPLPGKRAAFSGSR